MEKRPSTTPFEISLAPLDQVTPKKMQAASGDRSAKKTGPKEMVAQVTKQLGQYEQMLK